MNVVVHPQTVSVNVNPANAGIDIKNPIARDYVERDPYTGSYEITANAEMQVLETKNLRMTDNLVINPIPSNYGLVEWNGQYLTVS